ncbi:CPBP family intramembrane glutamic endopeptidase [Thermus brockianus]|uniref:CAAX amino protease n=1 Tax=Thermus brockianus TaxID=56956 RepID=A0ABM7XIE0_THEBO|nr:CPBP family intramembrane glutamic endopeptidase [Thermus brockianus]BDG16049.1 CAAX amino protease [Thermus brockianus]
MLLFGLRLNTPPEAQNIWVAAVLLFLLWALEILFRAIFPASFLEAERLHRQLGLTLKREGLGPPSLVLLAFLSGVAEELFFRGLLQNLLVAWLGPVGLPLQALLFALLHPAPKRAFAYPLYTGMAGLLFGLSYLLTGSLLPGILAHILHNARGFYQLWREA